MILTEGPNSPPPIQVLCRRCHFPLVIGDATITLDIDRSWHLDCAAKDGVIVSRETGGWELVSPVKDLPAEAKGTSGPA